MSTEIDQDTRDGWRDSLDDFQDMWEAVFKPRGFSRDTAVLLWYQNLQKNQLDRGLEQVWAAVKELSDSN